MKKLLLAALLVAGISSFSAKITGPKYRVEAGLGTSGILYVDGHVSVLPEWKAQINPSFDITFGPKLSVEGSKLVLTKAGEGDWVGANVGFETDFNVKIPNTNNKFYVGLETGVGVGALINSSTPIPWPNYIGKLTLGGKINDKGNVGVYFGTGKGVIGVEGGYTF